MHVQGVLNDEFKQKLVTAWSDEDAGEAAINWYKANIPNFDEIEQTHHWPKRKKQIKVPNLLIWAKDDRAVY